MTALSDNQVNFLSPLNFQFSLSRTPETDYYTQSAPIPSIGLPPVNVSNPVVSYPIPGDHIVFGTMAVNFRIDQQMLNYMELYNWMISCSQLAKAGKSAWRNTTGPNSPYSDGNLVILNSSQNPIINVSYKNMFPINLSELMFDTRLPAPNYLECTVTFSYEQFTITSLLTS